MGTGFPVTPAVGKILQPLFFLDFLCIPLAYLGRVCFAAKRRKTQVVKLLFHFPLFVSLKNKLQNATLLFPFAVATVKFVVM